MILVIYESNSEVDPAIHAVIQTADKCHPVQSGVWLLESDRDVSWWAEKLLPHRKKDPLSELLVVDVDARMMAGHSTISTDKWFSNRSC